MREPEEILARAKALLCAELDQRVATATQRLPHLCTYNHRQPLDERKRVDGDLNPQYNRIALTVVPTIGLCMLGSEDSGEWQGTICEDPIDAKKCPFFTSTQSKEQILKEFLEQTSHPEWLESNMPRVHELLWAAGYSETLKIPFWKRLYLWLTRIKVEPVVKVPDLTPLLTAPKHENISP